MSGTGATHLTERQTVWISHRLSLGDDLDACVSAGVSVEEVISWRENPAFSLAVQQGLWDKRGAFRQLTEQMMPLATRVIYQMLASGDDKTRAKGLALLLRSHGMLIDVKQTSSPDQVRELLEQLRAPVQVEVANVEPRE